MRLARRSWTRGGVVAHGFEDVLHRGEHFVVNVDEGEGQLGLVGTVSSDGGDGVPLIEGFFGGQAVVAEELGVDHGAFAQVNDPAGRLGEIGGGYHGVDAGHGLGLAGVDALDAGVSVGAAEDLGVEHPRQADVGAILGAASNLVGAVVADGTAADNTVAVGSGGLLGGSHGSSPKGVGWYGSGVMAAYYHL